MENLISDSNLQEEELRKKKQISLQTKNQCFKKQLQKKFS